MTERPGDFHGNIFDIGGLFIWFFENLAKPVTSTIGLLMKSGFVGFTIAFALFFILLLTRQAAGAKNTAVFGALIGQIGRWGVFASGAYLILLSIEKIFMPPLTILFTALGNTLTGGHPGIFDLIKGGTWRDRFFEDVGKFYANEHLLLPLGFNSTILLLVTFTSMLIVSHGVQQFQSKTDSPPE